MLHQFYKIIMGFSAVYISFAFSIFYSKYADADYP